MEDSEIVDLFLLREEQAIVLCAQKYGSRLRSLSRRIYDSDTVAEECENDTYLHAWQSIPPHEPRDYLFAFLAKITRSLALDALRRDSRQKRSADFVELSSEMEQCIPSGDDVAANLERKHLGALISRFLRAQKEEKRRIFLRRYYYMESVADISAALGISQGKVKTVLFRLRGELKEYLEKEDYSV